MTVLDHDPSGRSTVQNAGGWFATASFGLFIHFDQASQQGLDLSWPMVGLTSDDGHGAAARDPADYLASVATFDPDRWNPQLLAREARAAGMTYAVFTTKHHSGWAAWPSKAAPINIASSPYGARGGDLVREFVEAFRAEGLRVGLYYSVSDWSDPDYPAWRPEFAPYSFEDYPRSTPEAWQRYREGLMAELRELLTDYGRIDLLWFDGGWERTEPEWGSTELEALIRALQPEIVLNDRLPGVGDYSTPEQTMPSSPLEGPWETCVTMNNSWGWNPDDHEYKSTAAILRTLVQCVSRGGSLLLNVSPDDRGGLPVEQERILHDIAGWSSRHSNSVIGVAPGLRPWQFYGPSTISGRDLYLHLVAWPDEMATVLGLRVRDIESVSLMTTGESLAYSTHVDPARARDEDVLGTLNIPMPAERPQTQLPVVHIAFSTDVFVPRV